MANVTNLVVLNSADKARHYSVAIGKGAISDNADPIVTNVALFPVGSQYTDLTNKKFYVRMAVSNTPVAADWTCINAGA